MFKNMLTNIKSRFFISLFGVLAASNLAWAAEGTGLNKIVANLIEQVQSVATLLVVVAAVAGVGFILVAMMQFKAHKDNAAQNPLSKPIVYLAIGACLLFLPYILTTSGETIFGEGAEAGKSSFNIEDFGN